MTDATKRMAELEQKYFDLVWIARRSPEEACQDDYPGLNAYCRINREHKKDVAELTGEHADWQHGFNSGCLAAFRLALGLLSDDPEDREMAIQEFPFLDT